MNRICTKCKTEWYSEQDEVWAWECRYCKTILDDQGMPWDTTQITDITISQDYRGRILEMVRNIGEHWYLIDICQDEECNCSSHDQITMREISEEVATDYLKYLVAICEQSIVGAEEDLNYAKEVRDNLDNATQQAVAPIINAAEEELSKTKKHVENVKNVLLKYSADTLETI